MYGEYTYYMPVKVISGRDCVVNTRGCFLSMGKRALIVTGKSSARNGALKDVRRRSSKTDRNLLSLTK